MGGRFEEGGAKAEPVGGGGGITPMLVGGGPKFGSWPGGTICED